MQDPTSALFSDDALTHASFSGTEHNFRYTEVIAVGAWVAACGLLFLLLLLGAGMSFESSLTPISFFFPTFPGAWRPCTGQQLRNLCHDPCPQQLRFPGHPAVRLSFLLLILLSSLRQRGSQLQWLLQPQTRLAEAHGKCRCDSLKLQETTEDFC